MSSLSEADSRCATGDTICEIRVYEQEVIVVPVLFLFTFLVMLIFLLLLRFCPEKVDRIRPQNIGSVMRPQRSRRNLQGIDAPLGINPLEHESIALDVPTYSTFTAPQHTLAVPLDELAYASFRSSSQQPSGMPPELPTQRLPESFNLVSPLPLTFSMREGDSVSLYRARMGHRDVILRVLKDSASPKEKQSFLGFASFLTQLGAHPFLPAVLGVVSLRAPLITVVEELENRDLLGFLWRCRQDHVGSEAPCDLTERRIFTMSNQVASALDYLHKRDILHGNVGARSVLVSRELTAKLWGLGNAYARKTQEAPVVEGPWQKKWQAPEVLARREATQGSDVWSFGILLYEMVTLGDAPFPDISVNELMQYLQRGKTLKRPVNCSNSLYSIIKSCCHWKEADRATLSEVIRKLQSGEKSANDKSVIRVPEPINIEKYLQEAGYGETHNYTVF
ncbi:tyrosine-protein kinase STYK1b [Anguilla rostrata]|uniref:tyrosine-protein kinase STYK1b n=1 Tax=Anguilla rostrata TaxID=7938 RepID=UPI0030D57A0D